MCDTSAYIVKNGEEELILSSLEVVSIVGEKITMSNIFGEKREVSGKIVEINYNINKITIES